MKTPAALLLALACGVGQAEPVPLNVNTPWTAQHVDIGLVNLDGRNAVRLSDPGNAKLDSLLILTETDFHDGDIDIDLAGQPKPGAGEGARGFVGLAFRVQLGERYELFYLRPTNARVDEQVRRNHTLQYVSAPGYPWDKLRAEFPGRYESYADMEVGKWTHMRINVRGTKARLYINHASQPALVLDDLKQGDSQGKIALWIGPGTVAHFSALEINRSQ